MKKVRTFIWIIAVVLALENCKKEQSTVVNTWSPNVDRLINFENDTLTSSYELIENNITYKFITKGTFYFNPIITTVNPYRGKKCIQYEITGSAPLNGETNDKSQHRIFSGSDANALLFGSKKFFGFAMKLDANMPQPINTVQFFQIWQGTPMSPPLEMRLLPGGVGNIVNFDLWIRNNTTTANPSSGIRIYQGSMAKAQWGTFILMVNMHNTTDVQNGEIKLWINNAIVEDWVGRAGYSNGIVYAGVAQTPNANFDAFFGPYRPCQQVGVKMWFDQIKYAGTYNDADPSN